MLKPKPLKFGSTVGIIAPASPSYEAEKINRGKKALEDMGFRVKLGKSCYERYGYLAGKDNVRAYDINSMFQNKEIEAIICLRGGYGSLRILDKIDYDVIKRNPKVFLGYSDITAIHIALIQKCGLVSFHGPMMTTDIAEELDEFTKKSMLDMVMGCNIQSLRNPNDRKFDWLYDGMSEGLLIGGNLTVICGTLGTPYEIDTLDKILFLEDIKEEPYKVDRMLTQLDLAGKLRAAKGIILGNWKGCKAKNPSRSLSLKEVFEDLIVPLSKPTIYNFMAGHCSTMVTLPLGVKVLMDGNKKEVFIKEKATL